MINFSENAVYNLKPIDNEAVIDEVQGLLVQDEEVLQAFQTMRDQFIFTNKRIVAIDVKGITGKKKEFSTLPYKNIQYYSIQTPGFAELIPDCELELYFNNGFTATFEFKGQCNIVQIGQVISRYTLV